MTEQTTEQAKVIRTLTGGVVSNKMNKTITVLVEGKVKLAIFFLVFFQQC
jgi:ribosomal protein S17